MTKMFVIDAVKNNIINSLNFVEEDINNCPDELWEKKYGGDVYWHYIYHTMIAAFAMLQHEKTKALRTDVPDSIGMLKGGEYDGDSSKAKMLEILGKTRDHIQNYFSYMSDSLLVNKVDFFGKQITILDLFLISVGHVMYHIGTCDAALRDHGAKGAI